MKNLNWLFQLRLKKQTLKSDLSLVQSGSKVFATLILGITILMNQGCSRDEGDSGDKSKLSISLPAEFKSLQGYNKVSALSAEKLVHVSISATGSGMSPVTYQWNSCRSCIYGSVPPSSFDIEVPGGTDRLIQILAVYEGEEMSFRYGDARIDATGGEIFLPIAVTEISAGQNISGSISGRYLSGTDVGPTGIVDVYYQPPSGSAMIVFSEYMFNGWFQLTGLSSTSFSYVLRTTGETLWSGPRSLLSFTVGNQVARFSFPLHIRTYNDGGSYRHYFQEAHMAVVGFWAQPGASTNVSSKYLCIDASLDSAGTNSTRLYRYQATLPPTNTAPSSGIIQFKKDTTPSVASLLDTTSTFSYVIADGGIGPSAGSTYSTGCGSGLNFVSKLEATSTMMDGMSREGYFKFDNIFTNASANDLMMSVWNSAMNSWDLTFMILPDLISSNLIRKLKVYIQDGFDGDTFIRESNCVSPEADGWTLKSTVTASVTTTVSLSASANAIPPGTAILTCAYSDTAATQLVPGAGRFFESRAFPNIDYIDLQMTNDYGGGCYRLAVVMKSIDDYHQPVPPSGSVTVTFGQLNVIGTPTVSYYSDANCFTSSSNEASISAGNSSTQIFVKLQGASTSAQITASAPILYGNSGIEGWSVPLSGL